MKASTVFITLAALASTVAAGPWTIKTPPTTWKSGEDATIAWTGPTTSSVKVDIRYGNTEAADSEPAGIAPAGSSSITYPVTDKLASGSDYFISVCPTDTASIGENASGCSFSGKFTIVTANNGTNTGNSTSSANSTLADGKNSTSKNATKGEMDSGAGHGVALPIVTFVTAAAAFAASSLLL